MPVVARNIGFCTDLGCRRRAAGERGRPRATQGDFSDAAWSLWPATPPWCPARESAVPLGANLISDRRRPVNVRCGGEPMEWPELAARLAVRRHSWRLSRVAKPVADRVTEGPSERLEALHRFCQSGTGHAKTVARSRSN